jgi:Uma2 family endonuclease
MSQAYEECFEGETILRPPPGPRHEMVCARLHEIVLAGAANLKSALLLSRRSRVQLTAHTALCPDLSLVTAANGRLWLAAEVISSEDHRTDTVLKKDIYEQLGIPRLWMVDTRYDNVEVYHATPYGLSLKQILAGRDILTEKLLPEFQVSILDLFAPAAAKTTDD